MNSDLGVNSNVLETLILLKYFSNASICESILIPNATAFFGISFVLLVNEIKVILFI